MAIDLRIIRAGIYVLGENPKKTDGEKNDREKDVELAIRLEEIKGVQEDKSRLLRSKPN